MMKGWRRKTVSLILAICLTMAAAGYGNTESNVMESDIEEDNAMESAVIESSDTESSVMKSSDTESEPENSNMENKNKDMEDMTAMGIVNDMKIGWNIGNTLDSTRTDLTRIDAPFKFETAWGNPKVTQELIDSVLDAGFNVIRVPVSWTNHIGLSRSIGLRIAGWSV